MEEEFKDAYVMLKILKIPAKDESLKSLYKNIVTYNNSQNSINEKAFVAVADVFKRVQNELEGKGILLCIKQSDNYSFSKKYTKPTALLDLNKSFLQQFGLEDLSNRRDFTVQLEKFLQVILSFVDNPQHAVQRKSKLLVRDSRENDLVVNFIRRPSLTSNDYLYLYLLYLRAEKEKKASKDGKNPNAFYLVHCFAKYECNEDEKQISKVLSSKEAIDYIVNKYQLALSQYYDKWKEKNPGKEYNDMIKATVDYELLNKSVSEAEKMMEMMNQMKKNFE